MYILGKNFNVENKYKYFFSIGNKILILEKSHDVTVQDTGTQQQCFIIFF